MLSLIWVTAFLDLIRTIESALAEYISFFGMITNLSYEDSNGNSLWYVSLRLLKDPPGPTRPNRAKGQQVDMLINGRAIRE